MTESCVLFSLNWNSLLENLDAAATYQKDPNDLAYVTFFGIHTKTGMPAWFCANKTEYMMGSPEKIMDVCQNRDDVQPTALKINDHTQFKFCMPMTYEKVLSQCGHERENAVHSFKANFSEFMVENLDQIYEKEPTALFYLF